MCQNKKSIYYRTKQTQAFGRTVLVLFQNPLQTPFAIRAPAQILPQNLPTSLISQLIQEDGRPPSDVSSASLISITSRPTSCDQLVLGLIRVNSCTTPIRTLLEYYLASISPHLRKLLVSIFFLPPPCLASSRDTSTLRDECGNSEAVHSSSDSTRTFHLPEKGPVGIPPRSFIGHQHSRKNPSRKYHCAYKNDPAPNSQSHFPTKPNSNTLSF